MFQAFDMCNHELSLVKLENYDLSLQYITCSARCLHLKFSGCLSRPFIPLLDVPEGSNLETFLFNIFFINDLMSSVKHSRVLMFADVFMLFQGLNLSPTGLCSRTIFLQSNNYANQTT